MNKFLTLFIVSIVLSSCKSKTLKITDTNFLNALLTTPCVDTDGDGKADSNADLNNDGEIQFSEIENLEFLDVSAKDIQSLDGIQYFTNLKTLNCYKNKLKALDVSKNKKLETLYCYDNEITILNVSNNKDLVNLGCRGNKLVKLDLSQNKKLKKVLLYKNNFTQLNINNGNNANISTLWTAENPNLSCIKIDANFNGANIPMCDKENYSGWCKDSNTSYNSSCSN